MSGHVCDIRWAESALKAFTNKYGPDDTEAVNSILVNVREHPDNLEIRQLVEGDKLAPEIESVKGDVYLSSDGTWDVYYNWEPEHIYVVWAKKR
jgi:hypothetical protein